MAELITFRSLSCSAKGLVKQYNRAIELDDLDDMAADAGFLQYTVIARSGSRCGQTLGGKDLPYDGNAEIVAYNAAKQ